MFNMRYHLLKIFLLLSLVWTSRSLLAQQPSGQDTTSNGEIEIIFQQKLRTVIKDGREVNHFQGDVVFKHDDVYIFCDTGTKEDKIIRAWGNVVIKQGDTLNIFSDRLYYDGDTKIADLERNVVLENRDQKLFTRKLTYDVANKVATYSVGATLTDDKTYLRSRRGNYYVRTSEAYFQDSVVVLDPEFSLKTDTLLFNSKTKIATFLAPTLITYDDSRIYTEAGYYELNNKYAVFNKNPQYLSESQRSKAEIIIYDGEAKEVQLINEAVFEEEDKVAKADTIIFYETTDLVDLIGNARYREDKRTADGDRMIYDRKSKQFRSPGRITINDPPQFLAADSVDFDNETGLGIAFGSVHWQDTAQNLQIFCEEARYNKAEDYIKAWGGRPLMVIEMDNDYLFAAGDTLLSYKIARVDLESPPLKSSTDSTLVVGTSDSILRVNTPLLDSLGLLLPESQAKIQKDTIQPQPPKSDTTSIAEIVVDKKAKPQEPAPKKKQDTPKGTPKAKPEERKVSDSDLEKLYEHAPIAEADTAFVGFEALQEEKLRMQDSIPDSLLVGPFIPDSLRLEPDTRPDTIKMMLVYHDVKIYRDDMRGICDSLAFNTLDSIFSFYHDPAIWSDSTQFTGDTIAMLVKDKKIHRMDLLSNALIISSPNEVYYDQIRGKLVNAHFKDGSIDNVLVTGNAETVYYVTDNDGAYNGVNSKQSSRMRIFFKEKAMTNIRFYAQPEGKFIPMGQADHESLKLTGFNWQMTKRPASFESITDLDWIPWTLLRSEIEQDENNNGEINPEADPRNPQEVKEESDDMNQDIESLGKGDDPKIENKEILVKKNGNQDK